VSLKARTLGWAAIGNFSFGLIWFGERPKGACRVVFVLVLRLRQIAGAVEMWKSRRWRFPRAVDGGGKLDVELGFP